MTMARCQCCAVCPDCAHHGDAWYDEYGSGNEIIYRDHDRKRHAYMQSIGDFDYANQFLQDGPLPGNVYRPAVRHAPGRGYQHQIGGKAMAEHTVAILGDMVRLAKMNTLMASCTSVRHVADLPIDCATHRKVYKTPDADRRMRRTCWRRWKRCTITLAYWKTTSCCTKMRATHRALPALPSPKHGDKDECELF